MYYRINMQTLFLKIFVCKLVENHLSAILTNFCQSRRRFPYSGRAFQRDVQPLGHLYRKDEAVFIEFETVDADYAVVPVCRTEWMAVVDDVEIIAAPHDAVMSCACSVLRVTFQYGSDSFERTIRRV